MFITHDKFIGMIVILEIQHSKALAYIEDHLDTKDAGRCFGDNGSSNSY